MSYKIFAIELQNSDCSLANNLLYLGYEEYHFSDDNILNEFISCHPLFCKSKLRTDLISTETFYTKRLQAKNRLKEYSKILEIKGFEIIAGSPLINDYYQVYIYEVDGNPKRVYVGESHYNPEVRFRQHCVGFNCSKDSHVVGYSKLKLRPDLYLKYPKAFSRTESRMLENVAANDLRCKGYTVYGGR